MIGNDETSNEGIRETRNISVNEEGILSTTSTIMLEPSVIWERTRKLLRGIVREGLLREFFSKLPKIGDTEVFVYMMGARKKYDKTLDRSYEAIIKKVLRKQDEDMFVSKVLSSFASLLFRTSKTNQYFSFHSLSNYFHPEPRDMTKAFAKFSTTYLDRIASITRKAIDGVKIDEQERNHVRRMDVLAVNSVINTSPRKIYYMIDIDFPKLKTPFKQEPHEVVKEVAESIGDKYVAWTTSTRQGVHIVYFKSANKHLLGDKILEKLVRKYGSEAVEYKKQVQTPMWGVPHGGKIPKPYVPKK